MKICAEIEMIPVLHGTELFAREVRRLCSEQKFDCVAVDIPPIFQHELGEAVDNLPLISALVAYEDDDDADAPRYYIPIDPCDAMIEGVRQARSLRIPFYCVGEPKLYASKNPLRSMPDEYSIYTIGFDAYMALCRAAVVGTSMGFSEQSDSTHIGEALENLRYRYDSILAITHLRRFEAVKNKINPTTNYTNANYKMRKNRALDEPIFDDFAQDKLKDDPYDERYNSTFIDPKETNYEEKYKIITRYINPDHLYFALGELPFVAAKSQIERHDPLAEPLNKTETIKDLFMETRDNYFDDKEQVVKLSPVRIQTALTYLRNLTVMSGRLLPSLFDIVEAAKGVGGNAYALRILKSAKYYPFLPLTNDDTVINIGIDRISLREDNAPDASREVYDAVNLFRDTEMFWRTVSLKPDPSMREKKKYRYSWNNRNGLYSHLPEDLRLESFNVHARGKAIRVVTEHLARASKFTSSVKDGIDIRETMRNWYTGNIYVKELPPIGSKVDTVVIIFDELHDNLYPQRATWYAEHKNESTLSFYATEALDDLVGPGIARCTYGGVALLFPPRDVPDLFVVTGMMGVEGCAARLVAGSLFFSREKNVAYIAAKAPSLRFRALSRRYKKHLVWIPLSAFSTETLHNLRHFHVLNGKNVRSWASRFIGDK